MPAPGRRKIGAMRSPLALDAIAIAAALAASGCWLAHGLGPEDGAPPRDAAVPIDAPLDEDAGAPVPACCSAWEHAGRISMAALFDGMTVTPRLMRLRDPEGGADRVGLVVTGPSDPIGPSGAHLVLLTRELAMVSGPRPLSRGSFTWGQPVADARGERFAVCWGAAGGNVARVFDALGAPRTEVVTLTTAPESPCVGSAFDGARFAFAFYERDIVGAPHMSVGSIDPSGSTSAPTWQIETSDEDLPSSTTSSAGRVLVAVADERIFSLDARTGELLERAQEPGARAHVAAHPDGLPRVSMLRVRSDPARAPWALSQLDPIDLGAVREERAVTGVDAELAALRLQVTAGTCDDVLVATGRPSLVTLRWRGDAVLAEEALPREPAPGPRVGDVAVLALGTEDAYVAFSATPEGALDPIVHLDRYRCAPRATRAARSSR